MREDERAKFILFRRPTDLCSGRKKIEQFSQKESEKTISKQCDQKPWIVNNKQTRRSVSFFFSRHHRRHLSWQLCSKKTIKVYIAVNTAFFAVTRKSFSSFLVHFFYNAPFLPFHLIFGNFRFGQIFFLRQFSDRKSSAKGPKKFRPRSEFFCLKSVTDWSEVRSL